jgi:aryl-alcohol dehydrogenase-like predicted oxidoreductase
MQPPTWQKRRLGRTGFSVTPIGIGGAYLGHTADGQPDERVAIDTVLRGLELGLNVIDTSPKYLGGESERLIGLALQEWYARGGKREDLILSTKTGSRVHPHVFTYDHTMESVATSLELLQTDYFDVLLVHDPQDIEPVFAPDGALAALKALKAQGTIRAIGLGCRPHAFHQRCIESGEFDVSLTFGDYNLARQSAAEGVLAPAAAHDVGVYNATVNMGGLLSGRDPLQVIAERGGRGWARGRPDETVQRAHAVWQWAQARGIGMLALNLQYCMREPRVASTLIGFSRPSRVDEDVAACLEPIGDEVWQELYEEFGL